MTRPQLIVDCETTSLTPQYEDGSGTIWELTVIERGSGVSHLWRMKPDLALADPASLAVGRYYERTSKMCTRCRPDRSRDLTNRLEAEEPEWSDPEALAADIARLLADVTLIAANPAFDAAFLAAFLRRYGQAPAWHYRLRDIQSMAYGYLCSASGPGVLGAPPIDANTDDLARALGVNPEDFERHSAMGDCLFNAAVLDVIEGSAS